MASALEPMAASPEPAASSRVARRAGRVKRDAVPSRGRRPGRRCGRRPRRHRPIRSVAALGVVALVVGGFAMVVLGADAGGASRRGLARSADPDGATDHRTHGQRGRRRDGDARGRASPSGRCLPPDPRCRVLARRRAATRRRRSRRRWTFTLGDGWSTTRASTTSLVLSRDEGLLTFASGVKPPDGSADAFGAGTAKAIVEAFAATDGVKCHQARDASGSTGTRAGPSTSSRSARPAGPSSGPVSGRSTSSLAGRRASSRSTPTTARSSSSSNHRTVIRCARSSKPRTSSRARSRSADDRAWDVRCGPVVISDHRRRDLRRPRFRPWKHRRSSSGRARASPCGETAPAGRHPRHARDRHVLAAAIIGLVAGDPGVVVAGPRRASSTSDSRSSSALSSSPLGRPTPRLLVAVGFVAAMGLVVGEVAARPMVSLYLPIVAMAAAYGEREALIVGTRCGHRLCRAASWPLDTPISPLIQRGAAFLVTMVVLALGTRRTVGALEAAIRRARSRTRPRAPAGAPDGGRRGGRSHAGGRLAERRARRAHGPDDPPFGYTCVSIYLLQPDGTARIGAQRGYETSSRRSTARAASSAGSCGPARASSSATSARTPTTSSPRTTSGARSASRSSPAGEILGVLNVEDARVGGLDESDRSTLDAHRGAARRRHRPRPRAPGHRRAGEHCSRRWPSCRGPSTSPSSHAKLYPVIVERRGNGDVRATSSC